MFDEGQRLPHAYHRTKYESERLVREGVEAQHAASSGPASSSATRETGEMDKIDGPYYFFKLLQRLRHALPEWFPLAGPQGGETQHRAGRLRRPGDGPHRPPARRRAAGQTRSTSSTPSR